MFSSLTKCDTNEWKLFSDELKASWAVIGVSSTVKCFVVTHAVICRRLHNNTYNYKFYQYCKASFTTTDNKTTIYYFRLTGTDYVMLIFNQIHLIPQLAAQSSKIQLW